MTPEKAYGIRIDEKDALWLERIVIDEDAEEALAFVKGVVHRQIVDSEKGRLQSHLDHKGDPAADLARRIGRSD